VRTRPLPLAPNTDDETRSPLDRLLTALVKDRSVSPTIRRWAGQLLERGEVVIGAMGEVAATRRLE
jgi:hypothetical protein